MERVWYGTIIRSFPAEGDGKSIMEGWSMKGSFKITYVVSVVCVPAYVTKDTPSVCESLTGNRVVKH
jgi:hypothetical protein